MAAKIMLPLPAADCQNTPGRASAHRVSNAASCRCTTRLENAHGIPFREVLYPWHPWFGLSVAVHEAVGKSGGVVFRCTLSGSGASRGLEVPSWMFDRTACAAEVRFA